MKNIRLFTRILKITKTTQLFCGFGALFILSAFVISIFEPQMGGLSNALWFCFASVTTIGYGDFNAVSLVGRCVTILLSLYGIILVAITTGSIVNYIGEVQKIKAKESVSAFLEKLEHLDQLSKDELASISERIRNNKLEL